MSVFRADRITSDLITAQVEKGLMFLVFIKNILVDKHNFNHVHCKMNMNQCCISSIIPLELYFFMAKLLIVLYKPPKIEQGTRNLPRLYRESKNHTGNSLVEILI